MGQPKDIGGMGFRNLECFNLSVMAKQLCRIINHPDYLVASIIKEKYFRQGELLTVKAKTSSSMMWRRIISARKFIDSGARWRVGNGERPSKSGSTDGCRHQPLSKSSHQLVISMIMLLSKSCSNSVQPKEDVQNEELISNTFWAAEANTILGIPLSKFNREDRLIWGLTEKGSFSIKSAYCLARKQHSSNGGRGSQVTEESSLWNTIWKLPAPGKVRNFLWRIYSNT